MRSTRSQTRATEAALASSRNNDAFSTGSKSASSRLESASSDFGQTDDAGKIKVVSWLQLLLDPVLKCESLGDPAVGLKHRVILDLDDVRSSATATILELADNAVGDRIRLLIPYADTTLNWTFLFCWMDPTLPPDMGFDDDFQPSFWNYEEFYNWDPIASAECFLKLVRRLFDEYRKYQLGICESHSRLQLELSCLREVGIQDGGFETYVYQTGARRGDVVFVFPIKLTALASLPKKFTAKQTFDDFIRLKIRWGSFGDGRTNVDVELTPFINMLFSAKTLRLPAMESLLSEYIPEVTATMNDEIAAVGVAYNFRRDLVAALIASYPSGSLINYCSEEFTSASFLLEHEDFKFILSLALTEAGPLDEKAVIQARLRSIYHETKQGLNNAPQPYHAAYNLAIKADWTAEKTVKAIRGTMEEKIVDFKRKSCQEGK